MDKEDLSSKGKEIAEDKMSKESIGQRRRVGYIACVILFLFLITFTFFYGEPATLYAIYSLLWTFLAADEYEKYRYTNTKMNLVSTIVFGVAALIGVLNYVFRTLK